MSAPENWRFETKQVHSGAQPDPTTKARATPIYQTTSYVFDNTDHAANLFSLAEFGNIYTRIMNPTQDVVEQRIAALEGGTGGLLLASGQAASTFAVLNIAQAGDHFVASSSIYGGTYNLFKYSLAKLGIEVTFVENQDDIEEWRRAVRPNTKLFFAETIGNPQINVLDIRGVADAAHEAGVPLIVDNTIATPYLIRPLEHGADIVVHSATKFLGGHGTVIGGTIVDGGSFSWTDHAEKFPGLTTPDPSYHGAVFTQAVGDGLAYIIKARVQLLRDLGASISPQSAWQLIQGIETLSLRIERHVQNAQEIAEWLDAHDDVASVNYSGLPSSPWYAAANRYAPKGVGAVLSFELKGGVDAGREFVNSLELFSHLANIGDVRSLVIHPASTTHSQLSPEQQLTAGVTPGLVRLSVGIENVADLKADLDQALAAARRVSEAGRTVVCTLREEFLVQEDGTIGGRPPEAGSPLQCGSGARARAERTEAAVDAEHLPGDPRVRRVEEERDGAGDIGGLAEAAERVHRLGDLARPLVAGEGCRQRRLGQSRRDRVHPQARRRVGRRSRQRQSHHPGLRRGDGLVVGQARHRGGR